MPVYEPFSVNPTVNVNYSAITPLHDYILVKLVPIPQNSPILYDLPDLPKYWGYAVKIGPQTKFVKCNDYVLIDQFAQFIEIQDGYIIVKETDILAISPDNTPPEYNYMRYWLE